MNNGNFTWRTRSTSTLYSQQRLVNYILLQTLITIGPSHPHTPTYNTSGSKLSTSFYFRGFKTRNQIRHYFTILNQLKYISYRICRFMINYHTNMGNYCGSSFIDNKCGSHFQNIQNQNHSKKNTI